jgi:acetyl/propionyl-CoA carboxylase alpha subunit
MTRWWTSRDGRRLEIAVRRRGDQLAVQLDGTSLDLELVAISDHLASLLCADGRSFSVAYLRLGRGRYRVSLGDREFEVELRDPLEREVVGAAAASGRQEIRAPIPGKVVRIDVNEGDEVSTGQPLLVLEAMKMENQIAAEGAGRVSQVLVAAGGAVEGGQLLAVIE